MCLFRQVEQLYAFNKQDFSCTTVYPCQWRRELTDCIEPICRSIRECDTIYVIHNIRQARENLTGALSAVIVKFEFQVLYAFCRKLE
jgi:hypothetical protein